MTVVDPGSVDRWEPVVVHRRIVVRGDAAWVSGTASTVAGAQQEDLVLRTPRERRARLGTGPARRTTPVEIAADAVREPAA